MKPSKEIIIDEIVGYIREGRATEKIYAEICSKFQLKKRTFYNYFKIAEEKHIARQRPLNKKKEALDTKKAINTCVKLNITIERIATVLLDILENKKANVKPADQIAAGKQLCVMFGFNESSKTDVSISGDVKTVIQLFADQPPLVE